MDVLEVLGLPRDVDQLRELMEDASPVARPPRPGHEEDEFVLEEGWYETADAELREVFRLSDAVDPYASRALAEGGAGERTDRRVDHAGTRRLDEHLAVHGIDASAIRKETRAEPTRTGTPRRRLYSPEALREAIPGLDEILAEVREEAESERALAEERRRLRR